MGIEIPPRLRRPEFRFVLVAAHDKLAVEKDWTGANNYSYDSPTLASWLEAGGNYGVLCGAGDLLVLDCDAGEMEQMARALPPSFEVRSGGRKLPQIYYRCPGVRKVALGSGKGHIGDLQGAGSQVVGPGCIHPTGGVYEVAKDLEIAVITQDQLAAAFSKYLLAPLEKRKRNPREEEERSADREFNITDFVSTSSLRWTGEQYQGAHPLHGSDTGKNFSVHPGKNAWYCFRCGSGGGVLEWIAVREGLIRCDEARSGCLDKVAFKTALYVARKEAMGC